MAAHIYTALLQVYANPNAQQLSAGLDYARPFGQLDLKDWDKLKTVATMPADPGETIPQRAALIRAAIADMLPTYGTRWEKLNHPRTLEEWQQRYNERLEEMTQ